MPSRLYAHLVWTTRNREPILNLPIAQFLARFLPAVAWQERAQVLALGLVRTHIHLLIRLHPTTSIPRLLQRMKGGSAAVTGLEGVARTGALRWAKSYDIQTVSPRALEDVAKYVREQHLHHAQEAILGWPQTEEPWRPIQAFDRSAENRSSDGKPL